MKLVIEYEVSPRFLGKLALALDETAEKMIDSFRCPSVEKIEAVRCELDVDHNLNTRHVNGTLSWPHNVVVKPPVAKGINVGTCVIDTNSGNHFTIAKVSDSYVWLANHSGQVLSTAPSRGFWSQFRLVE